MEKMEIVKGFYNKAKNHRYEVSKRNILKIMKFLAIFTVAIIVLVSFRAPIEMKSSNFSGSNLGATGIFKSDSYPEVNFENLMKTTTNWTDTDNDSVPDSVEAVLGTDIYSMDSDGDGLDDYYELSKGLNPMKMDSNGDGYNDGSEVEFSPTYFSAEFENKSTRMNDVRIWNDDVMGFWREQYHGKEMYGYYSFKFWGYLNGDRNHDGAQYLYIRAFKVNIKLGSMPRLSYWIYHENGTFVNVAVGATCADGTTIRDFHIGGVYIRDQYGVRVHPSYREDPTGRWYFVEFDLSPLKGKTIRYITIAFDYKGNETGKFSAYVDHIRIWEDDPDGDGIANEFDNDNDNDGVKDGMDISPFARMDYYQIFNLELGSIPGDGTDLDKTYTTMNIEIVPKNAEHMKYVGATWDWPYDEEGQMRDLDNSTDDLRIQPVLSTGITRAPPPEFMNSLGTGMTTSRNIGPAYWSSMHESPEIGWNNAGGGMTIADLNRNGIPDVITMGIDDPSGPNRFWYKVGWDIDGDGNPSKWSETFESPEIGNDDQGGGLDVWDIDGNGIPDLVFMAVDNPEGANSFWYMIAWNIRSDGSPSSWSGIVRSPEIGYENVGGGLAIGDINNNGRPDFILAAIDNPPDHNQTYWYMIAWDVDTAGNPSGWSDTFHTDVIGHLFCSGGADLVDLDGDGQLDLILGGDYDLAAQDEFKYMVGWDVNQDGSVSTWSPIYTTDALGFDTQGMGITVGKVNDDDALDILLMAVDNPDKANNFRYKVGFNIVQNLYVPLYPIRDVDGSVKALQATIIMPSNYLQNTVFDFFLEWLVIGNVDTKQDDGSITTEQNILARYFEDFMVVGLRVTVNYPSPVYAFYLGDVNDTIKGYTYLRYEFLTKEYPMDYAEQVLRDHGLNFDSLSYTNTGLFSQPDTVKKAMRWVVENRHPGDNFPLIYLDSEAYRQISLRSFVNDGTYVWNWKIKVNLSDASRVETRLIKVLWGNGKTADPLLPSGVIGTLKNWNWMDDENRSSLAYILMNEMQGAHVLYSINGTHVEYEEPEEDSIIEALDNIHVIGYGIFENAVSRILSFIKRCDMQRIKDIARRVWEMKNDEWVDLGEEIDEDMEEGAVQLFDDLDFEAMKELAAEVEEGSEAVKAFEAFEKLAKGIEITLVVIAVIIVLVQGIIIAAYGGWSFYSIAYAVVVTILTLAYLAMMMAIASLGVVGAIIAAIIFIADIIATILGHGSGWIIEKIASAIIKGKPVVNMNLNVQDTLYHQESLGGIMEGNDLTITTYLKLDITPTDRGHKNDVEMSYLNPDVEYTSEDSAISIPICTTNEVVSDMVGNEKIKGHVSTVKFHFDDPAINAKVNVVMKGDYLIRYGVFTGKLKWKTASQTGKLNEELSPLYFDIFPRHLDNFLTWNAINLNDRDLDGIHDSLEGRGRMSYFIKHAKSGKVVDIFPTPGGKIIHLEDQWYDTNGELWTINSQEDGTYSLNNVGYGDLVLDGNGKEVYPNTWNGGPFQRWYIERYSGFFLFHQKATNNLLDGDGENVYMNPPYIQDDYQHWNIEVGETDSSASSYDTDGDGLNDYLEANVYWYAGLDPAKADSDGDGLNDGQELKAGSSSKSGDTDADSLGDYREVMGWEITLNYSGTIFREHVDSSPVMKDTDRDGLSDYQEYQLGLNPRSNDTDGDGIPDSQERLTVGIGSTVESDTDRDGLSDEVEIQGWEVTYHDESGLHRVHVRSDPLVRDTDGDGVSDFLEYMEGTNPLSVDTDGDGLGDLREMEKATNATNYDTDGDGLWDSSEIVWGTSPFERDSDGDDLWDYNETVIGTSPTNEDSDFDGISDSEEISIGTDPRSMDSDHDGVSDNVEIEKGTDPLLNDTDSDGLEDGIEFALGVNPLSNDTDGDGLLDGLEISLGTDVNNNDTDGDGLQDSFELLLGTSPIFGDEDVPNQGELLMLVDSYSPQSDEEIAIVYDNVSGIDSLIFELSKRVNIEVVDVEIFLKNPDKWRYVVMVGNPSLNESNSTWSVMKHILDERDINSTAFSNGKLSRLLVLEGVWAPQQRIVFLSKICAIDPYIILGMLLNEETFAKNGVYFYTSKLPKVTYDLDAIKFSGVWVELKYHRANFLNISIISNAGWIRKSVPAPTLREGDMVSNRYLFLNFSKRAVENQKYVWIYIFYTEKDLDMDSNGHLGDIVEDTLCVYYYDSQSEKWIKLTLKTPWVHDIIVNTTDVDIYGTHYAGYVAINITNLNTTQIYVLAGKNSENIMMYNWIALFLILSIMALGIALGAIRNRKKNGDPER